MQESPGPGASLGFVAKTPDISYSWPAQRVLLVRTSSAMQKPFQRCFTLTLLSTRAQRGEQATMLQAGKPIRQDTVPLTTIGVLHIVHFHSTVKDTCTYAIHMTKIPAEPCGFACQGARERQTRVPLMAPLGVAGSPMPHQYIHELSCRSYTFSITGAPIGRGSPSLVLCRRCLSVTLCHRLACTTLTRFFSAHCRMYCSLAM